MRNAETLAAAALLCILLYQVCMFYNFLQLM